MDEIIYLKASSPIGKKESHISKTTKMMHKQKATPMYKWGVLSEKTSIRVKMIVTGMLLGLISSAESKLTAIALAIVIFYLFRLFYKIVDTYRDEADWKEQYQRRQQYGRLQPHTEVPNWIRMNMRMGMEYMFKDVLPFDIALFSALFYVFATIPTLSFAYYWPVILAAVIVSGSYFVYYISMRRILHSRAMVAYIEQLNAAEKPTQRKAAFALENLKKRMSDQEKNEFALALLIAFLRYGDNLDYFFVEFYRKHDFYSDLIYYRTIMFYIKKI